MAKDNGASKPAADDSGNKDAVIQPSPAPAKDADVTDFPLTLEEFCTRLSATDKRVELIGAFFHDETQAGKVKDTHAAFTSRFTAFATKPV